MSLDQRIKRMSLLSNEWGWGQLPHPLMATWKIPECEFSLLRASLALYLTRALHLDWVPTSDEEISSLSKDGIDLSNVTPNGAVVPKREYQIEYNGVLGCWSAICRQMIIRNPSLLSRFRVTPNIRIKFGQELDKNVNRPLNTGLPHSDAWVEGPWGMNCFLPIMGDCKGNTLLYYDTDQFKEEYLSGSETYTSMQWVLEHYKPIPDLRALAGNVNLSDYALIHRTERTEGCGTRVSIDTTIMVGDYEVKPERIREYTKTIPDFRNDHFMICHMSEKDPFEIEKSPFEHYTKKSLELIELA